MPYYSQQQHTSLHASTVQRKHLNLLLFDQSDEVKRIYDGTGRLPTHTLSPQRLRESINKGTGGAFTSNTIGVAKEFNHPGGQSAHAARGFSGLFPNHSTIESHGRPLSESSQRMAADQSPHDSQQQPTSLTSTVNKVRRPGDEPLSATPAKIIDNPSWLMPWQTGDREAGRKTANAVCKSRVPGGGFANIDLAKAI